MIDEIVFDDSLGVIVIADDRAAETAALRSVSEVGARVLATYGWAAASESAVEQTGASVLLIEAAGMPPDLLYARLPGLVAAAGAKRTIVAFDAPDLDVVAAALIETQATLLCDPRPVDRITAFALVAATRDLILRDSSGEAARLARLHQEVARFTHVLTQLTAGGRDADAMLGDRRLDFGHPFASIDPNPNVIRRTIRARRMRDEAFGVPGIFEDPAWDMILDLYAASLEGQSVSVSSLCIAAAVAPTTALRWISKLIEAKLFERRPDSFDRRRAFVALTERGATAMTDYIEALSKAKLFLG